MQYIFNKENTLISIFLHKGNYDLSHSDSHHYQDEAYNYSL